MKNREGTQAALASHRGSRSIFVVLYKASQGGIDRTLAGTVATAHGEACASPCHVNRLPMSEIVSWRRWRPR